MAAPTTLSPTERTARARLAAHARWANDPDRDQIRQARQSSPGEVAYWLERVERDHPELTPKARRRLAISKRSEYMARLVFKRERARARRKGAA